MAWKVLSNLKTDVLHKVGEVLEKLEGVTEEEIKNLEKSGVIQNLAADAKADEQEVKTQAEQDVHTAESQAEQDAELARGQVDEQVKKAAEQDVADAQNTAAAPGEPVNPTGGQPSPEDVAATAAGVQ